MSNKLHLSKRSLILILGSGFLLVLLTATLVIYPKAKQEWITPLGESLNLPTHTPTTDSAAAALPTTAQAVQTEPSTIQNGVTSAQVTLTTQPSTVPASPTTSPTPTAQPLCGGPSVMTILGVGADNGQDYMYGLGDVIRVARIDFVTPKVSVLSLPRDLWVELPEIRASNGVTITHSKLNQSYFYGGKGMGMYTGPGGGPGLMARTLDLNFGLAVDHYGAVNMVTFSRIVDAVGGIDLYLPHDVDGTPVDQFTEDMGYFTAGHHHFNGDQALRFSRIRKRYGDFVRQDDQTMVLCALRKKVLTPAVLPKIPKIIAAFQGQVLTDLSPEQIGQLACLLPNIKRENILFASLPDDLFQLTSIYSPIMRNNTSVLQADPIAIRDYVSQFMAGAWPTVPDQPSCP
jgi:LCP family protein required for cell wall assembly